MKARALGTGEHGVDCLPRVTSSVVVVSELLRSVRFYRDLFSCKVTIATHDSALLLAPDGFQVYLLVGGRNAPYPIDGIGLKCLIWAVDSATELNNLERAIQEGGRRSYRRTSGGVTFLTTRDPDGIRILVAHPGPAELPRFLVAPWLYA